MLKQSRSEEIHAATVALEARAEELQSILDSSRRGWQDESAAKDQALARLQVRRARTVGCVCVCVCVVARVMLIQEAPRPQRHEAEQPNSAMYVQRVCSFGHIPGACETTAHHRRGCRKWKLSASSGWTTCRRITRSFRRRTRPSRRALIRCVRMFSHALLRLPSGMQRPTHVEAGMQSPAMVEANKRMKTLEDELAAVTQRAAELEVIAPPVLTSWGWSSTTEPTGY
jgi:hypothetical protein